MRHIIYAKMRLVPTGTPLAEIEISSDLVLRLLADQHPDLAHLPLQVVDAGWDNAMFRLGDGLAVRLPRRSIAARLVEHEQIWLPRLAPNLSLPVPAPCRFGAPATGYPWRWSVVPWLRGTTADQHEPAPSEVRRFVDFLRSLHKPAPPDAPANPVRGVPLSQRAEAVQARLQRLARSSGLITPRILQIWNEALHAPLDLQPTWIHGDLHPRNVIVHDGVLTGIIDWGDITSGDPATDLAFLWMHFSNAEARDEVLAACSHLSDATLARAKGWAVLFGVMLLETGLVDNPAHALIGERILTRLG
jgi:aminoglycoside phosphotransferase (APT) family kinase protein